MPAYSVALVVDPSIGDELRQLSARLHTWVVATPANHDIAKSVFATLPDPTEYTIENGMTTFTERGTPEECCISIIEDLDQHHDKFAHEPGYTILEVYGAKASSQIRTKFSQFGFVEFLDTEFGFMARKHES